MTSDEFAELVEHAAELRKQLKGRLPERIYWKWQAWLLGTVGFTTLERGAYMALLHRQLDKGSLPADPVQLAAIAEVRQEEFAAIWQVKLSVKFREHAGELYNVPMLLEFIAAAEPLLKRRSSGQVGGRKSGQVRAQQSMTVDDF